MDRSSGGRQNAGDLIDLGEPPPSQLARLGDELDLLDAILGGMLEYAATSTDNINNCDSTVDNFTDDGVHDNSTDIVTAGLFDGDIDRGLFGDLHSLAEILNFRSELDSSTYNDDNLNISESSNFNNNDNVSLLPCSSMNHRPETLPPGSSLRRSLRRSRRGDTR